MHPYHKINIIEREACLGDFMNKHLTLAHVRCLQTCFRALYDDKYD